MILISILEEILSSQMDLSGMRTKRQDGRKG